MRSNNCNRDQVNKNTSKDLKKCMRCGKPYHEGGPDICPAQKSTCHRCKKVGHWDIVYLTKSNTND